MDFSFLWTIHEIHVSKIQQCVVPPEVLDYVLHTDCYSISRWATAPVGSSEMTKSTVALQKGQNLQLWQLQEQWLEVLEHFLYAKFHNKFFTCMKLL